MKKNILCLIILIALSVIALKDYFATPYLPLFHDQVQAERVQQFRLALFSGQFPVRFVSDLGYGYGYPLFNYYAPLPYFVGTLFSLIIDLVSATKLMIVTAFIAAGMSCYVVAVKIWGRAGGLLSAILYLLAPYHAVQTYVRGSVGELYAYALFPLLFWSLFKILRDRSPTHNIYLVVATTLLFISHTISAYIALLIISITSLISFIHAIKHKKQKTWLINSAYYLVLPLFLASFFLIPALQEISLTQLSLNTANDVKYDDHFVTLGQLWNSPWGYGGSAATRDADGMSFMVGKLAILLSILSLSLLLIPHQISKVKINSVQKTVLISAAVVAICSTFLTQQISNFVWQTVPYMQLIQFPWRFLTLITLMTAILSGGAVIYLRKIPAKFQQFAFMFLFILIAFYQLYPLRFQSFFQTKYFAANGYYQKNEKQITDQTHLRYEASKISDEYLPAGLQKPQNIEQISYDDVTCFTQCNVKDAIYLPGDYKFTILLQDSSPIYLQKVYFPNFSAVVDGKFAPIEKGSNNTMGVFVSRGEHRVEFKLHDTPIRTAANLLSFFALIILVVYHGKNLYGNR